jgi:hypothetical protein
MTQLLSSRKHIFQQQIVGKNARSFVREIFPNGPGLFVAGAPRVAR